MMENQAQYNRQVAGVPDPPKGTYGDTWAGSEAPPSRQSIAKNPVTRPQIQTQPEPVSPEEARLLNDCSRQATLTRGLPAGLLAGVLVKIGVDNGYFIAHPRFGAIPKMIAAGTVAYLTGKVTYANTCSERFLNELPDSNLARQIRINRGMPYEGGMGQQPQGGATGDAPPESDRFESAAPLVQQPAGSDEAPAAAGAQPRGYDEMRRMNRFGRSNIPFGSVPEQQLTPYQQKQSEPQQQQPIWGQQERRDPSQPDLESDAGPPSKLRSRRTNKYGDEGFE